MHAFVTIAAMTVIFAAHIAMMLPLRPRGGEAPQDEKSKTKLGETL
ncbi:MAG TPA: hypothetical protein VIM56_10175 [Rhizomicrobium sp.]